MNAPDDLVELWESIELQSDGITIRHWVDRLKRVIRATKMLRKSFSNGGFCQSQFYIRPFGLRAPDIDLTRTEC